MQATAQAGDGPSRMFSGEGMFPDSHDPPSGFSQQAVHRQIPPSIANDLGAPEFRVLFRPRGMRGATMPEAAVDKHDEPLFPEHEIRAASPACGFAASLKFRANGAVRSTAARYPCCPARECAT